MGINPRRKIASRLKNTVKWIVWILIIVIFCILGTIEHDPFHDFDGLRIEPVMRHEVKRIVKKAPEKKKIATNISPDDCYGAMKQVWPRHTWSIATDIIRRESGGNCNAVSPTDDHGCFQINHGLSLYGNKIYDPVFNAKIAYEQKYLKGGWRHWMCCPEYW